MRSGHSPPPEAWDRTVRPRTGEPRTPETLIPMGLRELEIHHTDLNAGYTFTDIPQDAARWILDDIADAFSRRTPASPSLLLRATDTDFQRDLILQRHSCSGEWVAAASVMGESGLVLSASSESGPGPDMVGPVVTGEDEGDEQAADLG
ncbi:hypothetical protein GCM10010198_69950 [Nocardia seriolae]|nr:hypothetical protein [Nocardia seriolae]